MTMVSSVQVHNQLQEHYKGFQELMKKLGESKGVYITFTDVCLPDPEQIKNNYAEECRVDWSIEVRADHEPFFSYAVLLNDNNQFDGYAVWFADKDNQEHFNTLDEVVKRVNVRLDNF